MQTIEGEPSSKGLGVETDDLGEAELRRQAGGENKIPRNARDRHTSLSKKYKNGGKEIRREGEVDNQHI